MKLNQIPVQDLELLPYTAIAKMYLENMKRRLSLCCGYKRKSGMVASKSGSQ